MLRHTSDPVERALALVVIARAAADHAAFEASPRQGSQALEVTGSEQVLTAALQHLHDVRRASHYRRTPARSAERLRVSLRAPGVASVPAPA